MDSMDSTDNMTPSLMQVQQEDGDGGTITARFGFLADQDGQLRASLTGRWTDAKGRVLQVGAIHTELLQNFQHTFPALVQFALAHGADDHGCLLDGMPDPAPEQQASRAKAWAAAHGAMALLARNELCTHQHS